MKPSAIALALLMGYFAYSASAEPVVVRVAGPAVVGFFPPTPQKEQSGGVIEGRSHLGFALSDTETCLGIPTLEIHIETTTKLILETPDTRYFLELPAEWPRSVGAYMFSPGKTPKAVYSVSGPSSLVVLLPEAAASYFERSACRGLH